MDLKVFASVLATVFLAELGDKTQLATLLFAAERPASRLAVFAGAAVALVLTSALGTLAGAWLGQHVNARYMMAGAGALFIAMGAWSLYSAYAA